MLRFVAIRSRRREPLPTVRFIEARRTEREDQTMKTISTKARMTSLALAVLTSVVVLGSTVAGIQAGQLPDAPMVVMEKITITPTALN
jgi:hypothetical protein